MDCILPTNLTAGLTYERLVTLTAYPASDGWVLSVYLRGTTPIDIVGTASGNQHRIAATAAESASWTPGLYSYTARVELAGEVFEVDRGAVEIMPDLAAAEPGYDGRDHIRKVLDAINAVIEKRATLDQERYVIAGQNGNRELWRTPIEDLLKLQSVYQNKLRQQNAKCNGGSFGRLIRVRLQ